jgi:polyhydroxyalkanoate synthesis regulator phasin
MNNEILNMSATSIVALFQTNKEERKTFIEQVVNSVYEGEVKAIDTHLQIKAMEEIIEAVKSDQRYKDRVLSEAQNSGSKFEYQNAKFDIREVGTKYDFSNCNDAKHVELTAKLNALKEEVKQRENYLKNVPIEGIEILDSDTAELVRIYPPSKSSTTSVIVTMK